ncbi:Cytochrome P450 [Mycena venus]|uniref:Cytochrome P450 n=1 Tax=Mycena venus TaxID=2733690 RepID=A0A8H7CPU1_9AGAR|nr:Cytochrome P450 [Mycena venus]
MGVNSELASSTPLISKDLELHAEEDHKRIRTALNVGFTAAAVRNYIPVFEKAAQAVDDRVLEPLHPINPRDKSLPTPLVLASLAGCGGPLFIFRPQRARPFGQQNVSQNEIGTQVLREKRVAAEQGLDINTDLYGQLLDLHRLDKTKNTLTEAELVAQTAITMIAGQDTTANTLAFGLVELARAPEFQDKLRAEIHSTLRASDGGSVSYDNMPLLNAFIKESLRIFPAEAISKCIAVEDIVIPLTILTLAIASYQWLESRWGEDAQEFKPSRWLDGPTFKGEAVGPYANLFPGWPTDVRANFTHLKKREIVIIIRF